MIRINKINYLHQWLIDTGLLLVIISLLIFPAVLHAASINVKTYIPVNAKPLLPLVGEEIDLYFPEIPVKAYIPSLIEHESCISLTHSRCWNSHATLKSSRELGIGLGQTTKAFNVDGTVRFDSLKEMRDRYRTELKELSWENIADRPDLQIRFTILLTKNNYTYLYNVNDEYQRLKMADAAYSGGLGGLQKERRACGLSKDCDPQQWDNNVERYCLKSKKPLYGGRNACDINRHHVVDATVTRIEKYKPFFQ